MADDTFPRALTPEPLASARVREAMEQWRRRSRLIRFLRQALPAAIAALGLVLVGWVSLKSLLANLPDLVSGGAVIRMTNPRFYGQDSHGRAFVLGGKDAARDNRGRDLISMSMPVLSLSTGPGKTMSVSATHGVYDQVTRRVGLAGTVHIVDSGSGWVFDTSRAGIDTRTGVVWGPAPVHGRGPLGETSASSYAIVDNGAKVTFTGNVRSHIVQTHP
jgi:lipopolysaccharide export system protein LptC